MPVTVLKIDDWSFVHVDDNSRVGPVVKENLKGLRVRLQFEVDCTIPLVRIDAVELLNANVLQPLVTGVTRWKSGLGPGDPSANDRDRTFITDAKVELFGVHTLVLVAHGIRWANQEPARDGWGIPRVGFRARAAAKYQSRTSYYSRKYLGSDRWGDPEKDPTLVSQTTSHTQLSSWSDLSDAGATWTGCTAAMQMPPGTPRDWSWSTPQEHAASAPPADPADGD